MSLVIVGSVALDTIETIFDASLSAIETILQTIIDSIEAIAKTIGDTTKLTIYILVVKTFK